MLVIGDIHIYASDFEAALRFWAEGLQIEVAERGSDEHSTYARLDFPDGGPSLALMAPAEPWEPDDRSEQADGPEISFDIMTDDFDAVVVRLLENGGQQFGEIETYESLRTVTIADPDGNTFDLIELPADAG